MTENNRNSSLLVRKGERGQILPLALLMMGVFFCIAGFGIDVGRVYVTFHALQASTDAAALAGGEALGQPGSTTTGTTTVITNYSSESGMENASNLLSGATLVTGYPVYECYSSLNIPCYGASSYNAVKVQQQVTVPMTFANWFGQHSLNLTAESQAAMAGAATVPYNVAIIIDTTASMNDNDGGSQCSGTRLACSLSGIQTLLSELYPCAAALSNCNPNSNGVSPSPVDQVSIFTFPSMTTDTNSNDYTCPTSNPTIVPYTFPPTTLNSSEGLQNQTYTTTTGTGKNAKTTTVTATYEITYGLGTSSSGYLSNYRTSDSTSGLNQSSQEAVIVGDSSTKNCGGVQAPGGESTYYAAAIYAAANSLLAQQAATPGQSQNVIILISDGDAEASEDDMANSASQATTYATNSGTYPSWVDECGQAITAAAAAKAAGIKVYSVAYGAESSGCSTDTSGFSKGYTPCQTMEAIASSPAYFYSDYEQGGSGIDKTCISSANSTSNLNDIFSDIAASFTVARLIPNSVSS